MNFGFTDFCVVDPYPPVWRETRAAAGAAPLLKHAPKFDTLAGAVGDCELVIGTTAGSGRKLDLPGIYLPELAARLKRRFRKGGRVAVLFGSEKHGLSNEHLEACHWILTIPTDPRCPSMNLGQSVALVCYELARKAERAVTPLGAKEPEQMTAEQVERLVGLADEVLLATGYMTTWKPERRKAYVRRMLLRWGLKAPDEVLLGGALRWTLKKVK